MSMFRNIVGVMIVCGRVLGSGNTIQFLGLWRDTSDRAMPIRLNVNPNNPSQIYDAFRRLVEEMLQKGVFGGILAAESFNQMHWSADPCEQGFMKHGYIGHAPEQASKSSHTHREHRHEGIQIDGFNGVIDVLGGDWQLAVYRITLGATKEVTFRYTDMLGGTTGTRDASLVEFPAMADLRAMSHSEIDSFRLTEVGMKARGALDGLQFWFNGMSSAFYGCQSPCPYPDVRPEMKYTTILGSIREVEVWWYQHDVTGLAFYNEAGGVLAKEGPGSCHDGFGSSRLRLGITERLVGFRLYTDHSTPLISFILADLGWPTLAPPQQPPIAMSSGASSAGSRLSGPPSAAKPTEDHAARLSRSRAPLPSKPGFVEMMGWLGPLLLLLLLTLGALLLCKRRQKTDILATLRKAMVPATREMAMDSVRAEAGLAQAGPGCRGGNGGAELEGEFYNSMD